MWLRFLVTYFFFIFVNYCFAADFRFLPYVGVDLHVSKCFMDTVSNNIFIGSYISKFFSLEVGFEKLIAFFYNKKKRYYMSFSNCNVDLYCYKNISPIFDFFIFSGTIFFIPISTDVLCKISRYYKRVCANNIEMFYFFNDSFHVGIGLKYILHRNVDLRISYVITLVKTENKFFFLKNYKKQYHFCFGFYYFFG